MGVPLLLFIPLGLWAKCRLIPKVFERGMLKKCSSFAVYAPRSLSQRPPNPDREIRGISVWVFLFCCLCPSVSGPNAALIRQRNKRNIRLGVPLLRLCPSVSGPNAALIRLYYKRNIRLGVPLLLFASSVDWMNKDVDAPWSAPYMK